MARTRTNSRPVRSDEEWDWEDPLPDPLVGSPPARCEDPTADLLVDLVGDVARLHVLLEGADEDEWRGFARRLQQFRSLVDNLPTGPRSRRRVGFRTSK